ncbi:MAG TPA: hypothetical protein VH298_05395 [Jatrophihabitans sp.]|nr:hypothetical protein [Jatrophihabitans sp.]
MLIDCDSCAARDIACGDCVVAVLLGPRASSVELDSAEQDALGAFASGGLLPPLRLVPTRPLHGSPPTERPLTERPPAAPADRPESDQQVVRRGGRPSGPARFESA